jgi:hypothetical protein
MDSRHLYRWFWVEVASRNEIVAGIPADPAVTEAWLRQRLKKAHDEGEILEDELRTLLCRTLVETGAAKDVTYVQEHDEHNRPLPGHFVDGDGKILPRDAVMEHIHKAAEDCPRGMSVFKKDDQGIYLESRCFNSMLRLGLSVTSVFTANRGAKQTFQHMLFMEPLKIRVHRDTPAGLVQLHEADGIMERPITVQTKDGPQTSIKRSEIVNAPVQFGFWIKVSPLARVEITEEHIKDALLISQDNGIGSDRSQEFGKFDVFVFEEVEAPSYEDLGVSEEPRRRLRPEAPKKVTAPPKSNKKGRKPAAV